MNVLQMYKGKERWSMLDDNTWDMLLGKSGRLPGAVGQELVDLAASQDREFFTGDPQELYPDELDKAREEMKENGWETGPDDEELFEMAMHPEQYRAYKSGAAKETFDKDLLERKGAKQAPAEAAAPQVSNGVQSPTSLEIEVNGEKFDVAISYGSGSAVPKSEPAKTPSASTGSSNGQAEILAPIEGNFMLTKNANETAVKVGDSIREGDLVGYIEAMKVYNAIHSDKSGVVTEIVGKDGGHVDEDDLLIKLS